MIKFVIGVAIFIVGISSLFAGQILLGIVLIVVGAGIATGEGD